MLTKKEREKLKKFGYKVMFGNAEGKWRFELFVDDMTDISLSARTWEVLQKKAKDYIKTLKK